MKTRKKPLTVLSVLSPVIFASLFSANLYAEDIVLSDTNNSITSTITRSPGEAINDVKIDEASLEGSQSVEENLLPTELIAELIAEQEEMAAIKVEEANQKIYDELLAERESLSNARINELNEQTRIELFEEAQIKRRARIDEITTQLKELGATDKVVSGSDTTPLKRELIQDRVSEIDQALQRNASSTTLSIKLGKNSVEQKPEVIEEKPEVVEQKPEVIEEQPEVVEEKPEVVEEVTEVVEEIPEVVEEKPEVVEQKPEVIEEQPEVVEEKLQVVEEKPEVVEEKPEVIEEVTEVFEEISKKEIDVLAFDAEDVLDGSKNIHSKSHNIDGKKEFKKLEDKIEAAESVIEGLEDELKKVVESVDNKLDLRKINKTLKEAKEELASAKLNLESSLKVSSLESRIIHLDQVACDYKNTNESLMSELKELKSGVFDQLNQNNQMVQMMMMINNMNQGQTTIYDVLGNNRIMAQTPNNMWQNAFANMLGMPSQPRMPQVFNVYGDYYASQNPLNNGYSGYNIPGQQNDYQFVQPMSINQFNEGWNFLNTPPQLRFQQLNSQNTTPRQQVMLPGDLRA